MLPMLEEKQKRVVAKANNFEEINYIINNFNT